MEVWLKIIAIVSSVLGASCISSGKFIRINGYVLAGGGSIRNSKESIMVCATTCLQIPSCLSLNYHRQNQECHLNTDSPYTTPLAVQEASEWAIYHLQRDNDWELVLRAQAYNNLNPYHAWMGTLSLPNPVEDGCRLMTGTSTCTTIYRHSVLDTWESAAITEVLLELYKDGTRVVNIRFDGVGSTKEDWFSNNNLIDSGWSTMNRNRIFNYFSLSGECQRRFFINQEYNGCPADYGWMAVIESGPPCPCGFDVHHPGTPAFIFAQGEDIIRWESFAFGRADVFAIFIKR